MIRFPWNFFEWCRRRAKVRQLDRVSENLFLFLDLRELSNFIVNTISEALETRTVSLCLFKRDSHRYWVQASRGFSLEFMREKGNGRGEVLVDLLAKGPGILKRKECLKRFAWSEVNGVAEVFDDLSATLIVPLAPGDSLLGFIAVGNRVLGRDYRGWEVATLGRFAKRAQVALRNALEVDELKRSVTELRDLQSSLIEAAKLESLAQLASGLAHEIHNPLSIISGRAQILLVGKEKMWNEEEVAGVLKTIVKQAERAADITRKLSIFVQPSGPVEEEGVAFEKLLDETLGLVSYQATLDQIEIVKQIEPDLPLWWGKSGELKEVFLNLILNAMQAIGKKGRILIHMRSLKEEGRLEIRVQDTGIGIPVENLSKVFNPFFSTREGATGLGLFVVQQILHRYGGSIVVESEPGKGSLFTLQLPLASGSRASSRDSSKEPAQAKGAEVFPPLVREG